MRNNLMCTQVEYRVKIMIIIDIFLIDTEFHVILKLHSPRINSLSHIPSAFFYLVYPTLYDIRLKCTILK